MTETGKHYKGISKTTTEITSKTTTTTRRDRFQAFPSEPVSRDFVEKILSETILKEAKPGRIVQAANKYKRSGREVEAVVHMLDRQYRKSTSMIKNATGLLITALRDIEPPEADAQGTNQKSSPLAENEYQKAENKLASLSEEEREKVFIQAKAQLHPALRSSIRAVNASAMEIVMSKVRSPG